MPLALDADPAPWLCDGPGSGLDLEKGLCVSETAAWPTHAQLITWRELAKTTKSNSADTFEGLLPLAFYPGLHVSEE